MYRTIIATKITIDTFSVPKNISFNYLCILKVICHLKENVQCLSKGKTKIMSFHYHMIQKFSEESLASSK